MQDKCEILSSLGYCSHSCFAAACVDTVRTRSRSNRNGAVLGSKKPRQGLPFLYGPSQYLLQAALWLNQIIYVNSNVLGTVYSVPVYGRSGFGH